MNEAAEVGEPTSRFSSCLTADGKWFIERVGEDEHCFRIDKVYFQGRTAFQELAIIGTREYGIMLIIDGETQSAEDDEYIYHEALVHPAMVAHPAPQRVLIIGGGEGATLRETLRHPTVSHVTMVDIDGEMISLAKQYLNDWHRGAFNDPRVFLKICDGLEFLRNTPERFDVAIIDVCDYGEGTAVEGLYNQTFFAAIRSVLAASGILVVQAGELGACEHDDHVGLRKLISKVFPTPISYSTYVESFWSEWSYILAGGVDPAIAMADPARIDLELASRKLDKQLRFYDGATHCRMFHLPKDVRAVLAAA